MLPKKGKGGEPPPPPQSDATCPLRILPACFIIPIHLNALKINHALKYFQGNNYFNKQGKAK